jgi:hypothetical protein
VAGSGYQWSGQVVSVFESDKITATLLLYDGDWCEAILGNKTLIMRPLIIRVMGRHKCKTEGVYLGEAMASAWRD